MAPVTSLKQRWSLGRRRLPGPLHPLGGWDLSYLPGLVFLAHLPRIRISLEEASWHRFHVGVCSSLSEYVPSFDSSDTSLVVDLGKAA